MDETGASLEDSRQRYMRAANRLRSLAEDVTRLEVPSTTVEQWKMLLSSIRIVDNRLDTMQNPEERAALTRNIKNTLHGDTADFSADPDLAAAMGDVRTLVEELPEERREFFVRTLTMILRVTEDVKGEKDFGKFTQIRRLEGQLTSKLFFPFLPDSYVNSDKYPELVQFFSRLGRLANSFDTLVDWRHDYERGQTAFKPTVLNRISLVGTILVDTGKLLSQGHISAEVVRQIVRSARSTMQDPKGNI